MAKAMRTDPLLSILMLTFNDGKYLDGCLKSIGENVSCPFEVILVDNGSSEAVPGEVTSQCPWLRVIRSEKNLGFNAGNNLAAKNASGRYILLLNIDTVLLTDVAHAVRLLGSDLRIGVVGAQAYDASGKLRPSAGHFPKPSRLWLFRSLWSKPRVPHGPVGLHAFKVDWIEGSFLMTSLENWLAVGGFDGKNFLFGNDVDFCRSTTERGLAVVHCTDVKYVHFWGYGMKRMGNKYAGFREYHRKFSGPFERRMADFVLRTGLVLRILAYGLWYWLTKDVGIGDKLRSYVEVRRNWDQLTP
jgi:GT2 family glycosyltransferase